MTESVDESRMSFMEHLGELRTRLMRSLLALLVGLGIALPFSQQIMDYLAKPARDTNHNLVFLSLTSSAGQEKRRARELQKSMVTAPGAARRWRWRPG